MKMTVLAPQIRIQDRKGFWTAMVKVDGEESEVMALSRSVLTR